MKETHIGTQYHYRVSKETLVIKVYKVVRAHLVATDNKEPKVFKVFKDHKVVKVYKALDLFGKVFGVIKLNMPETILFFIMDNLG